MKRILAIVAQVTYGAPANEVVVRKGAGVDPVTLSGNYTPQNNSWPMWMQDINGISVMCFGEEEGKATLAVWAVGDYAHSIDYRGLGGETMSYTADELATLVSAIK